MRLYLRLARLLVAAPWSHRVGFLDEAVMGFRVLPADLDLFGHMNNGRYAMLMDLARADYLIKTGAWRQFLLRRWIVPIKASAFRFERPLRLFDRCEVATTVAGWDERNFYLRQQFRSALDGRRIVATGLVCMVVRGSTGVVPTASVLDVVGLHGTTTPTLDADVTAAFKPTA